MIKEQYDSHMGVLVQVCNQTGKSIAHSMESYNVYLSSSQEQWTRASVIVIKRGNSQRVSDGRTYTHLQAMYVCIVGVDTSWFDSQHEFRDECKSLSMRANRQSHRGPDWLVISPGDLPWRSA